MSDKQSDLHLITDEELREKMVVRKWKHRRRMSYVSLIAMLLMTVALFFYVESDKLEKIQEAIGWAYVMFGSVVMSYLGASTWDGKK